MAPKNRAARFPQNTEQNEEQYTLSSDIEAMTTNWTLDRPLESYAKGKHNVVSLEDCLYSFMIPVNGSAVMTSPSATDVKCIS